MDILNLFELERMDKNQIVCKEGDLGDKFYIIIDGAAGVYIKNEEKATALSEYNQMDRLDRHDKIQSLNE